MSSWKATVTPRMADNEHCKGDYPPRVVDKRQRVRVVESSFPPKRQASMKPWQTILVGLAAGGVGFGANTVWDGAIAADRIPRIEDSLERTSRNVQNTAKLLERMRSDVAHMQEKQDAGRRALETLAKQRREDMKDIRKALRIPKR